MFNLLFVNGQEDAKMFLLKPPAVWHQDPIYQSLKVKVKLLKVINDCAEREGALVQTYYSALMKHETQKQYKLRLVSSHLKQFPAPMKAALNPLDAKLFFCQTPVGARLIFGMLLLCADLIFAILPPGADLFFEPRKRRDPRELS